MGLAIKSQVRLPVISNQDRTFSVPGGIEEANNCIIIYQGLVQIAGVDYRVDNTVIKFLHEILPHEDVHAIVFDAVESITCVTEVVSKPGGKSDKSLESVNKG